jgi:DNA-binding transcriptional ArsR family regulator
MSTARERVVVEVFFALGDDTRLSVVSRLGRQGAQSATALSDGAKVTRQAIVKHLQVLEGAGLVHHHKRGREVLYAINPERLDDARTFLDAVSASWDRAIERLRRMVEEPPR